MPIRDYNDSAYYYEKGRNLVFRDTARHRWEIETTVGLPVEKALPYTAETVDKYLDHTEMKMLPGPTANMEPITAAKYPRESHYELAKRQEAFVLPRPLIDIIASVSRLSRLVWYPSLLRMQWAAYTTEKAKYSLEENDFHTAASHLATVFGTLLPSLFVVRNKETNTERHFLEHVWEMLSGLVDVQQFVKLLEDLIETEMKFVIHNKKNEDIGFIRRLATYATKINTIRENRIGPPALALAEHIEASQKRIEEIERRILEKPISGTSHFRVIMLDLPPRQTRLVRFVSRLTQRPSCNLIFEDGNTQVMRQSIEWYAWVLDVKNQYRIRLLRVISDIRKSIEKWHRANHPLHIDDEDNYIWEIGFKPVPKKRGTGMRMKWVTEPSKPHKLMASDIQRIRAANLDARFYENFNQNEKLIAIYEEAKGRHAELVKRYERMTKGLSS
jgi:hypothetical protein